MSELEPTPAEESAEPSDPRLRAGRTLVGGEVRGRDPEHDDETLRVAERRWLE